MGSIIGFFTGFGIVNKKLVQLPFYYKFGIWFGGYVGGKVVGEVIGGFTFNSNLKTLLTGVPFYEKENQVPNIEKLYYFLDDDKNYEPNVHHHGRNSLARTLGFFKYLI